MLVYAILMFVLAIIFVIIAALIYNGKTNLIHDYHQTKVKDKAAYGKAFGKAMGVLPGSMVVSGLIALFYEGMMLCAIGALVLGLLDSIVMILRVQKKYNNGLF